MEREHRNLIVPELMLEIGLWWWQLPFMGIRLRPEGQAAARRIFRGFLTNPHQERRMSEDFEEFFTGFGKDFSHLENIPQAGPVLVLISHTPGGPLSFFGKPFLVSRAIKERRGDETIWLIATRFRLPIRSQGLNIGKDLGRQATEAYGGIYLDYGENNPGALIRTKRTLESGGVVGIAPDDIDRAIIPPKEIKRLKPRAIRFIAWLAEKVPDLSIVAAVTDFSQETDTLVLDFIPITERPEGLEDWERLIREALTNPVSP